MNIHELELALEQLELNTLEEQSEIVLEEEEFNQNGILIIDNKGLRTRQEVKEWSVEQ